MNKKYLRTGLIMIMVCTLLMSTTVLAVDDWEVWYRIGLPSNAQMTTNTAGAFLGTSRQYMIEKCNYKSGGVAPNGSWAYVSYTSYYVEQNGQITQNLHSTQYHYSTQARHHVSISPYAPANSTIYTTYVLHNPYAVNTEFRGYVYETDPADE